MRIASLIVLTVALAGCSFFESDPGPPRPIEPGSLVTDTTRAGLEQRRTQWYEADVAAYRFRFVRACECLPETSGPFEVVVREGEVASVAFLGTGDRAEAEQRGRLTVEALFDVVEDAFEREAAAVEVAYEPALGFPARVFVDYHRGMADDEFILTLTAFERLDR